jgi:Ca2+:H+ antiporter
MNKRSFQFAFFRRNVLNLQLVLLPLAFVLDQLHVNPAWVFLTSALAIIPLAGWLGKSTEALASTLGAGPGALLNATFGNAAEFIIAFVALANGYTDVVKASITGSIIGNVLLVLGFSVFLGGLKHHRQHFNATAAQMGVTLLVISAIGLLIPALFHQVGGAPAREVPLSLEISVILFIAYIGSLIFTLHTHRELYMSGAEEDPAPHFNRRRALLILLFSTAGIAGASELLVRSVEPAARSLGLTDVFIGVILVAIIGNAAEHSTAVVFALKNKIELSLNIAISSSVQMALFVAPMLVFVGALTGHPMDLAFTIFEVVAVIASVTTMTVITMDGEANWMEGLLLLAVYGILGLAFFHLPG